MVRAGRAFSVGTTTGCSVNLLAPITAQTGNLFPRHFGPDGDKENGVASKLRKASRARHLIFKVPRSAD